MRVAFPGMAVLAVVIASGVPATAHHSRDFFFDTTKTITLEGEIQRVEWINAHRSRRQIRFSNGDVQTFGGGPTF